VGAERHSRRPPLRGSSSARCVGLKRPNVHVIHLGCNAGLVRRSWGWPTRSLVGGVMVGGAGWLTRDPLSGLAGLPPGNSP